MRRKLIKTGLLIGLGLALLLTGFLLRAVAPGLSATPVYAASALSPMAAAANPNGFTYQGSLMSSGASASGDYGLSFHLYDALTTGNQVRMGVTTTTTISNGLFTVNLDFGPDAFDGGARFLEIGVQQGATGSFVKLAPRQPITPAPWALFALKTQGYANVVTVAKTGGDFTRVQAALDSITDAASAKRYLVWIAPGVYTETVTMKPFVDIEGAGQDTTTITAPGGNLSNAATLYGADNATLRSLTVQNTGGFNTGTAIANSNASPTIYNVTVIATGIAEYTTGVSNVGEASPNLDSVTLIATGSDNPGGGGFPATKNVSTGVGNFNGASASLRNVIVRVSPVTSRGIGLSISNGSSITVRDSDINATGLQSIGVALSEQSSAVIDSSVISGTSALKSSNSTAAVGSARLSGSVDGVAVTCASSYNGANARLNTQCQLEQGLKNLITVAKAGGDYSTITDALNSVNDASAVNRYLIKVAPGVYTERVTMQPFVDIEGAGQDTTTITWSGAPSQDGGTVIGVSNAALRSLTVLNTGGDASAIAIFNNNASPFLLNVTARATGGGNTNSGVGNFYNSAPIMTNSNASAAGGFVSYGIQNSIGAAPSMINVQVSAADALSLNYGVSNNLASATMTNTVVSAYGGVSSYGVYNSGAATTLNNVTINAAGGASNYGVVSENAATTIINSEIVASGASSYGLFNVYADQATVVTVRNSKISGGAFSVFNSYNYSTMLGASQLLQGAIIGPVTCYAVYDKNFTNSKGLNACP